MNGEPGASRTRGVPARLLFIAAFACSSGSTKEAPPDWGQVPVSIELRLAKGAPAPGLVPAAVYGQRDTVYLASEAAVSNTHIARVEPVKTRIGTGLILQVWLTKAGAQRIADVTAQHIGDSLAVLVNSMVVSVPGIQQAMSPGTKRPSDIGVPLGAEDAERLARAVSATWPTAQATGARKQNR